MDNTTSPIPENLPDLPDIAKTSDITLQIIQIINLDGDAPLSESITTQEVDVRGILLGD